LGLDKLHPQQEHKHLRHRFEILFCDNIFVKFVTGIVIIFIEFILRTDATVVELVAKNKTAAVANTI
jgi:hypothetical protein